MANMEHAPHKPPLDEAEAAELATLLAQRKAYRESIPRLNHLALRAYDNGQRTQVDMAEKGGWRHRDALRQLLNRLREQAEAGIAPGRDEED